MSEINDAIETIYETYDGPSIAWEYHTRVRTLSMNVLTILSPDDASEAVAKFVDEISGKVVVEIGAGVGYLALEMAKHAKAVYAIESDVAWSWTFTKFLYVNKPQNLTWIFGNAESVVDLLRADVAVICTRSAAEHMSRLGGKMADKIVLLACDEPAVFTNREQWAKDFVRYIDRRGQEIKAEVESVLSK